MDRQIDKQIDRQTARQINRQKERKIERNKQILIVMYNLLCSNTNYI